MNELTKHSGNELNTSIQGFGEGGDGITTTTLITITTFMKMTRKPAQKPLLKGKKHILHLLI